MQIEDIFHSRLNGWSLDWGSSIRHLFTLFSSCSSTVNTEQHSVIEVQQDKDSLLTFTLEIPLYQTIVESKT